MTGFFDDRSGIGVHQKRKVFELRNQYTLTDESGDPAGRVEQARQSALAWLARLGTSLDTVLPTTLHVTDASEARVLQLEKPWFTWKATVKDAGGTGEGQRTLVRCRMRLEHDGIRVGALTVDLIQKQKDTGGVVGP